MLHLSAVEECVELTHEEAARSKGRRIANVRGEIVPYIKLRESFLFDGESPGIEQIVITKTELFCLIAKPQYVLACCLWLQ